MAPPSKRPRRASDDDTMLIGLLSSLGALAVGPLLVGFVRKRAVLEAADGFVVVALLGLAFFHVLPEAFAEGGAWALAAAACGAFLPAMLERHARDERIARGVGATSALVAFAVHGLIDGVAITSDSRGHAMAIAIVMHRVPEGIAAWTLLRPAWGATRALSALAGLGCATIAGATLGAAHAVESSTSLAIIQAAAIGSVLHVVLHHAPRATGWKHHHDHATESDRHLHERHGDARLAPVTNEGRSLHVASFLGAVAGVVALIAMFSQERAAHGSLTKMIFVRTAAASAPWLLLACVASGFAEPVTSRALARIASRSAGIRAVLRAAVLAPLLPVCSCGVLPLYELLNARKVRASVALSVLVAAAGLGPATVLLTIGLLGPSFALARVLGTLLAAVLAGIGARAAALATADDAAVDVPELRVARRAPVRWSVQNVLETVDHATAWVVVGIIAAAVAVSFIDRLREVPHVVLVVSCALAGLPAYFGAAGVTPFAAVLVARGMSPGAALALTLTASTTNVSTLRLVFRRHGVAAGASFVAAIAGVAIAAGLAFDATDRSVAPMSAETASGPAFVVALVALSAIVAVAMLRHGPRHLLSQIVSQVSRDY